MEEQEIERKSTMDSSAKKSIIFCCHPKELLKWCCLRNKERDAHMRLGKKISYISLYEYCHIVDKHER
jgi:hypothetical protein